MPGYMVYWPQDRVKELEKAGDIGPIKVVLGSIHSRMPSIASVKVGDVVFPVTLVKKQLCVLARLPVEHREPAFDYCIRELGEEHGALIPEGVALEWVGGGGRHYWGYRTKRYDCPEDLPDGVKVIPLSEQVAKPHLKHQEPFNCCSQWAVWGEEGSSIAPRQLPDEVLPRLRFGPSPSKEQPLKFTPKGSVLSSSLASTRRMSQETWEIFEELFQ